jgi:3-phenylpropionate/trans-cinnamate dioxygenase ferredoxin reductase subunit
MSINDSVVIVGAGQGGFQTACSLRDYGFEGRITLVGDEATLPYRRPPLSKSFLVTDLTRESIQLRPESFFTSRRIDLILGEHAEKLERRNRSLTLRSGARLYYDQLVLATGACNCQLPFGQTLESVHYLRTAAEAESIRGRLAYVSDVVIIGAGFIGLEIAASLVRLQKNVVLLDRMPRVMSRALSTTTSDYFARLHASWGVKVVTGAVITRLTGEGGTVTGVELADGTIFPADLVLVGIGAKPNTELARNSGLPVRGGIVVDSELRTNDASVYAIGDCAEFPNIFDRMPVRLESIQNAVDQGRHVAAHIVGQTAHYTSVPWFWSDQADTKLQIVGLASNHDHAALRGSVSDRKFSVFCFKEERLVAVESINAPMDHMIARELIATGARLSVHQASDTCFDLKSLLRPITIN